MAGKPATGPPRTQLELLLWQRLQTYEEVVAEFTRLARELGEPATLSSRHLRRLAAGQRRSMHPTTARTFQVLLGVPAAGLLADPGSNDRALRLVR